MFALSWFSWDQITKPKKKKKGKKKKEEEKPSLKEIFFNTYFIIRYIVRRMSNAIVFLITLLFIMPPLFVLTLFYLLLKLYFHYNTFFSGKSLFFLARLEQYASKFLVVLSSFDHNIILISDKFRIWVSLGVLLILFYLNISLYCFLFNSIACISTSWFGCF